MLLFLACARETTPPTHDTPGTPTETGATPSTPTGDTGVTTPVHSADPTPTGHTGTPPPSDPVLETWPRPGVLTAPIDVELRSNDPTATVWYTLDGSWPDPATAQVATGPIHVDGNTVVRAWAAGDLGEVGVTGIWVFLDNDASSFSSNVPLLVLWTVDTAPTTKV
ncbi:MAG: chitobiase/beta-hexosaminidase C-terminal domain-containing protein [Alphaproteobacteria bacterium]|nr:chitobiase/beta-hexosaminidase C-terminal domain-containing protein [Alphaproteobacteria bacterium]MCB9696722.1 chitobiase/beta-hexosaminidase C-terminal domain-containing protein [Alphaproteobacteria bacterium]